MMAPAVSRAGDAALEREIDMIAHALEQHGPTERRVLANRVGARYWGPGRFAAALREAVGEGRVRRLSRHAYGPGDAGGGP
jgi:hypothetical protein